MASFAHTILSHGLPRCDCNTVETWICRAAWVLCHGAMVWAIIVAEPWTPLSLIAGGLLLVAAIGGLVWAFRVSARLASGGLLSQRELSILGAQLAGGGAVLAVAVVPILLLEPPRGLFVAQMALLTVIAGVAYLAARQRVARRGVALLYAATVVVGAAIIVFIKDLVGH